MAFNNTFYTGGPWQQFQQAQRARQLQEERQRMQADIDAGRYTPGDGGYADFGAPPIRDTRNESNTPPLHLPGPGATAGPPPPSNEVNPNLVNGHSAFTNFAQAALAASQQPSVNRFDALPVNAPPGGFQGPSADYEQRLRERDANLAASMNQFAQPWQQTQAPASLQGISDRDLFELYTYGNQDAHNATAQMLTSRFGNQGQVNNWLNQYGPGGQYFSTDAGNYNNINALHKKYNFGGNQPPAPSPVTPPGAGGGGQDTSSGVWSTNPGTRPTPTVGGGPISSMPTPAGGWNASNGGVPIGTTGLWDPTNPTAGTFYGPPGAGNQGISKSYPTAGGGPITGGMIKPLPVFQPPQPPSGQASTGFTPINTKAWGG